jgi:hypothetical protein
MERHSSNIPPMHGVMPGGKCHKRQDEERMRPSPLLLALTVLAACGGGSSSSAQRGTCPGTPCPSGQTCQSDGTCAAVIGPSGSGSASGGVAACTSADQTQPEPSALSTSAGSGAYVLFHQPSVTVGQTIGFTVPSGIVSLTIIEQAIDAPVSVTFDGVQFDNTAVPHALTSPDHSMDFDDVNDGELLPPAGQDASTYYAVLPGFFLSDSPGTGTLTLPDTTQGLSLVSARGGLPSGSWSAEISDYAHECAANIGRNTTFGTCSGGSSTSTYDVTVIAKPASGGIPASGQLDVVLDFVATSVGGVPLTAASAGSDPDVQRLVQTLQAIYAKQGITVSVTYQDAPASVQQRYATGVDIGLTGPCSDLSQLLRYGASGNVLNVFLVPALVETSNTGQLSTVGMDGTIPGPASMGGTVASGAAVSAADLRDGQSQCTGGMNFTSCGADQTAYIVAHEVGHFLGLYHPTEQYGFDFDPLEDTPPCECTSCSPHPSTCSNPNTTTPPANADVVDATECLNTSTGSVCGGGDNLMFWVLEGGASQGNLTAEQGLVMRANPVVH